MSTLSAEQVAQLAYQAGFRGDDLVAMTGIARRESGYQPAAHRTDTPGQQRTGDFGLWQINYKNVPALQQAGIISQSTDLLNPVTNARAAFYLYQQGGLAPWGAGAGGWQQGGNPLHGVNVTAARTAVTNASNQGLLGADFQVQSNTGGAPMASNNNPAAAGGPFTLPSDAKLYNNGMAVIAVFDLGGVRLGFDVNWFDGSVNVNDRPTEFVSPDQYNAMGVINGGNAEELRDFGRQWPTFGEFWSSILDQVIGKSNPARNDPGVLAVIAEFAARPDMSQAELNNKLQATAWFQGRTTAQLEWNGLSEAEKAKRRETAAAQIVETWFSFTGEAIRTDDPRITNHLEAVASGQMGMGAFTENVVKPAAQANPESTWSRQVRAEGEAQRQRGVDIENTAQRVKDMARRWGVQYTDRQFQDWGRQIAEKTMSEADVLELIKDQAVVLFPWKDRDMETATAAGPWMQTYERVMEQQADLFSPDVQRAMSAGLGVWDFEQQLKKSDRWLETKNAREEMFSVVSEAGRRLGFE